MNYKKNKGLFVECTANNPRMTSGVMSKLKNIATNNGNLYSNTNDDTEYAGSGTVYMRIK